MSREVALVKKDRIGDGLQKGITNKMNMGQEKISGP